MPMLKRIRNLYAKYSSGNYASPMQVEKAEYSFYLQYLQEGMTVFDVGANIGELSLLFSGLVGPSGKVHSFEASAATFHRLEQIVSLVHRQNIVLNHKAVADVDGTLKIHVYEEEYSGWNSLADRPLKNYGIDVLPIGLENVDSITIDNYCRQHQIGMVDLLKVDVEGAEYQVLLGAREMLKGKKIRRCSFEFGQTTFDMGNQPRQIKDYLNSMGYVIENIVRGDPSFPEDKRTSMAQFSMHIARPRQ